MTRPRLMCSRFGVVELAIGGHERNVLHTGRVTYEGSRTATGLRAWARYEFLLRTWPRSDPAIAIRRRASWPVWRRAVRPVGYAAWVLLAVATMFTHASWAEAGAAQRAFFVALYVVMGVCVLIGLIDRLRARYAARNTPN